MYYFKNYLDGFTNFKHFGLAGITGASGGWFAILHCDSFGL